jgi:crotonobetainyl-CoA:carnitine CoA-transferase CaiB-like acyl-CoA transferase
MTVPGAEPPAQRPGFGDHVSSLGVVAAIAAGLFARSNGNPPPVVDVSLLACGLWALAPDVVIAGAMPGGFPYVPRDRQHNPLTSYYRTADGRWLKLHLLESDRFWPEFCRHVERPDLLDDPRFASSQARSAHREELTDELDAIFAARTLSAWRSKLAEMEGVWAPLQTPTEVHEDEQVVANGYIRAVDYGDRTHSLVVSPAQFDEEVPKLTRAPDAGEHTDELLLECGLSWEEILDLKVQGTVT